MRGWVFVAVTGCFAWMCARGADALSAARVREELAGAQRRGDAVAVRQAADAGMAALGDKMGEPEEPDRVLEIPEEAKPLTAEEVRRGYEPYLRGLATRKWWRVGLDPGTTAHLPREAGYVIQGFLAVNRAGLSGAKEALAGAREAGNYLVWTQEQGGAGVIPTPMFRNGRGRAFEAVERFLRRAERDGVLDKVSRNGWIIDDLGDGGAQFDNGVCGVALFELYEATKDRAHLGAARGAAEWAVRQPPVPNWNYNAFSVYLLAKAYQVTGERRFLDSAKQKARLGIYPGQIAKGKYAGRWADPHNAKVVYHYIIVRGLAALVAAMPAEDPERAEAVGSLRAALRARNPDFTARSVPDKDCALDGLLAAEPLTRGPRAVADLADCGTAEALLALERLGADEIRRGKMAFGPHAWGRLLELRASALRPQGARAGTSGR